MFFLCSEYKTIALTEKSGPILSILADFPICTRESREKSVFVIQAWQIALLSYFASDYR